MIYLGVGISVGQKSIHFPLLLSNNAGTKVQGMTYVGGILACFETHRSIIKPK